MGRHNRLSDLGAPLRLLTFGILLATTLCRWGSSYAGFIGWYTGVKVLAGLGVTFVCAESLPM